MKRAIQVICTTAIIGWIMVSVMFIFAEPPVGMDFGQFAVAKAGGCVSIALAVIVARELMRGGIMITPNDDSDDDEW